jgi:hypothetical protein
VISEPDLELIQEYFDAVLDRDYRTARVCLMSILGSTNMPVGAEVIRQTHEMRPPA